MPVRSLTALPVYNEVQHVKPVLDAVTRAGRDVLVVDDGSDDGTSALLAGRGDVQVVTHATNRGYGAAILTAFDVAIRAGYDVLVTIDCDGQHEPQRIGSFIAAAADADVVSGSRYLRSFAGASAAPPERRRINEQITAQINRLLGLTLTDAFCGFKAYRVEALARLTLAEPGYGMPLEFWVEAVAKRLRIVELPVPLVYLDETRSFGGALDDGQARMAYYRDVIARALAGRPRVGTSSGPERA